MNYEDENENAQERAVYALAVSAGGVCFAATVAGLLRSEDGGGSWRDAYASLGLTEPLPTPAVALSPAFASDHTVFAGVHGAIMRSLDSGATWQYAELRTPPPIVTCLAVSPSYEEDGVAFAGTLEDGVFRSADRGSRWAAWNFGLIDLGVLSLAVSPDFGRDETLLAGAETGVFRSSNGGRAWRETGLPTDIAPALCLAFSPDYTQDGILFAGTESNGLWVTRDRGASWSPAEGLDAGAVNALVVARADHGLAIAALTDDGLLLSQDGGETWRLAAPDLPEDVSATCLVAPHGLERGATVLLGCSDGGVRQTTL